MSNEVKLDTLKNKNGPLGTPAFAHPVKCHCMLADRHYRIRLVNVGLSVVSADR